MALNKHQLILRRSKEAERKVGVWFLEHDGPDTFPYNPGGPLVTVTGRVGQHHEMQVDVWSLRYAVEVKNVGNLPKNILEFWNKVVGKAGEYGKEPALVIVPSNRPGITPDLHIISAFRHAELLEFERLAREFASSTLDS